MQIKDISINDYSYTLPADKIARYPATERDQSKLLVFRDRKITVDVYRNVSSYLSSGSLLIFNDTKVVAARLLFKKPSGGTIEIFCLEPGHQYADVASGMQQQGSVQWKCLIGGASKWKTGQVLIKELFDAAVQLTLEARYISKDSDAFTIELSWTPKHYSFAEVLHLSGQIPLPPYLKRTAEVSDNDRYQTVYAQHDGSVAAPTAGLHFTNHLFEKLREKNIHHNFVTLHVGAGTFKPVKAATMETHEMHAEFIDVPLTTIEQLTQYFGYTYAVGTTSARTLESLYWLGVKLFIDPDIQPADLLLSQWEPYDSLDQKNIPVSTALQTLMNWMVAHQLNRLVSKTQLLIAPGYTFRIIRGLITNFHQPQSTLLLLVAAMVGDDWKKLYQYALDNDFRFLSYGDGCLLETPALNTAVD